MSWKLYQYILARQTANECLAFSRKIPMQFRNGAPIDFLGNQSTSQSINQSPVKTHSSHFYLSWVPGLVFLSLRISYLIPRLFKKHVLSWVNRDAANKMACWQQLSPSGMGPSRREPGIPASHLEELQVDLVGQSFCFYIACQEFWEACLTPNIWGNQRKSKQEWQLINYTRQVSPYEIPSADLGCLVTEVT